MAIVQWGLPLLGALCWVMWARLRPAVPIPHEALFIAAAAAGWLWAAYAGGISRYGSLHGLLAPWVIAVLWLFPLSTALLPQLAAGTGGALDLAIAATHAAVLLAAGTFHAARAKVEGHAGGERVDIQIRRVIPTQPAASLRAAAVGASLSLPLYASLRGVLSLPEQAALVATGMNVVALVLYAGPLGRVLGQAFRLRQVEAGGPRFEHPAVQEIEAWRGESWLYRWMASPLPSVGRADNSERRAP